MAILTVAVPLIGALLVPIVGRISERLMKGFAVLVGFVTAGFTVALITKPHALPVTACYWIPHAEVTISLQLTGIGLYVAAIAACIGALTLLYSIKYMEPEESEYRPTRYYFLTVLFIGAMIALALSDNFLTLYIFWEIIGFCSYALIAYYYNDPKAVRAGTKAFIVTRFGDIGLLAGIVVLWAAMSKAGNPTFSISETVKAVYDGTMIPGWVLGVAGAGFIAGAIGKSAQFPLHIWLPDAMEAPTTISALIHAATLVNAGVYLCARTLPLFEALTWWPLLLIWIGAVSALLAAILALMEKDLKRVLAFSTISQLGYMMAGVGALSVFASQFHLLNHAIFKALLFLCAGAVIHATHTKNLYQMGGLWREMKLTHCCFLIGVLALAGVPIFNGFWSKDAIFEALAERGASWPLIILIVTALLTAAYAWRMYWLAFLGKSRREGEARAAPWQMALPLVVLAVGTLASWLYVGGYSAKLAQHLPWHTIGAVELSKLWQHTFDSPLMWIAAAVVVILIMQSVRWRAQAPVPSGPTMWLDLLTDTKLFGDWFWGFWVLLMRGFAALVRVFQTGDLNYNSLWIAVGLIAVLVMFLGWG